MSKIAAALLAASALAGTFVPNFASAASGQRLSSNSYGCDSHSAKSNFSTGMSKMGVYDPYGDGMRVGMFDPYQDGLRQVELPATPASCFNAGRSQI